MRIPIHLTPIDSISYTAYFNYIELIGVIP